MATIFCILSRNSIPFRSLFFLPSSYPFLVINSQRTFQQTNEHSHNAIFSFPLKLFGSAKGLIFTLGSCFPFCSVSLIQTMKFSMHRNVCTWFFPFFICQQCFMPTGTANICLNWQRKCTGTWHVFTTNVRDLPI